MYDMHNRYLRRRYYRRRRPFWTSDRIDFVIGMGMILTTGVAVYLIVTKVPAGWWM